MAAHARDSSEAPDAMPGFPQARRNPVRVHSEALSPFGKDIFRRTVASPTGTTRRPFVGLSPQAR